MENRICKLCAQEKVIDEYRFHSSKGYYSKTCKVCENALKRDSYSKKEKKVAKESDGTKVCPNCLIDKSLFHDYMFHTGQGYYHRLCKTCLASKRRSKYIPKDPLRKDNKRWKQCTHCNEIKELNRSNFYRGAGKYYKICKTCSDLNNKKKSEFKPKPDEWLKKCNLCEQELPVGENFYFNKKLNCYQYCCRKCDWQRKVKVIKEMDETQNQKRLENNKAKFHNNKTNIIITRYKCFDSKREFENDLTPHYVNESLLSGCFYCGEKTSGLDRIENNKGHTIENTVPCCWECNTTRMNNYTHEEMLQLGKTLKIIKANRKLE